LPRGATPPAELQAAGEEACPTFFVEADRIEGDVWEIRASAL